MDRVAIAGRAPLRTLLLAFFGIIAQVPQYCDAETVKLKLATAYSADNFQTQNVQRFADEVKQATAGRVEFTIAPGGELLKPMAIFPGVKEGSTAQAGEVIMSNLAEENIVFRLDSLPFLVNSYDDAHRLWRDSRAAVEKALDARGIVLLYAVPWPPQNLYSNRPINSVQDFKGLKMRSYNAMTERIAQIMGAAPVTIQVVDLAKAIADKQVDLMLTSSWTGSETKAWSAMKYYYKVNAWIPKNIVFINKAVYAKLAPELQQKLKATAQEAELRGWKLCKEKNVEFEAQLASHNIAIADLNPYIRNILDLAGEKLAREQLKSTSADDTQVITGILMQYTMGAGSGVVDR